MLLLFITFCWLTAKATGTALAKIEVEELTAHLSSRFLNMTTDYEFPHCACKVWGKNPAMYRLCPACCIKVPSAQVYVSETYPDKEK
jgi:hypothetical protein